MPVASSPEQLSTVQSIMGDLERFVQGGVETGTNLGYDPFQFPDDDRQDILGAFTTPNHPYLKPQVGAYFNSLLEQNAVGRDDLNSDILNDVLNNLVFQAEHSGDDINSNYEMQLHLAYRNLAETAYNIFPDEIVDNNRNVSDYVSMFGDHPEFPALGILDDNRAGRREFEQWLHHDYNLYEDMNDDYINELNPMYDVPFMDRLTQVSMGIVDDFLTSIYDIDPASLPWNKDSEYDYNTEPYMGAEQDASLLFNEVKYELLDELMASKALELGKSPYDVKIEGSDFTYSQLIGYQSPVVAAKKLAETHGTGEGTLFDYNYKDRKFRDTMLGDFLDLEPVERNKGPYADTIVESAKSLIGTDISRPGAKSQYPGGRRYSWTCADYACDAATQASIPWPVDENGKHSSYIPYTVNAFRGIGIPGKNNPNLSKQFDEIKKINEVAPGDFAFINGLSHSVVITQVYKDGTIEIAHTGGEDRPVFSKTYSKDEWEGVFARDMGVAFRFNGKTVK